MQQPQQQQQQPIQGITRINELPNMLSSNKGDENVELTYRPLNVHQNPFAMTDDRPLMPKLESNTEYASRPKAQQQYPLPTRDIPIDTSHYTHDETIRANYIPPPASMHNTHLLFNDSAAVEDDKKRWRQKQYRMQWWTEIWDLVHIPLMAMLLFLVFETNELQDFLRGHYSGVLKNEMGQFSLVGRILNALLFGGAFFALTQGLEWI
jgi:hypothetical protein